MTTIDTLLDAIRATDEATALEATHLLAAALDAEQPSIPDSEVFAAPLEHRAELSELCRLALITAATDPETRELVAESLAGAGRKQLVLGGVEIVVIGALALGVLRQCLTRGRASSEEVITTERRADGSETTTVRRKVVYDTSAKITKLLNGFLNQ